MLGRKPSSKGVLGVFSGGFVANQEVTLVEVLLIGGLANSGCVQRFQGRVMVQ